jgi:2'-5' RNA ligase
VARVLVVCAAFDAVTDARIDSLRDAVEAAGHRVRRAHRPHLTLSAARMDEPDEVVALASEVAARHATVRVTMTGLGTFPSGVLFVAPDDSPGLRSLQRDAYDSMRAHWPPAFGGQTAPGEWIPHCTLATRLTRRELHELRTRPFDPFVAVVDAIAVIAVGGSGDLARIPLAAESPLAR